MLMKIEKERQGRDADRDQEKTESRDDDADDRKQQQYTQQQQTQAARDEAGKKIKKRQVRLLVDDREEQEGADGRLEEKPMLVRPREGDDGGDYRETRGGEAFLRGRKKKQGKEKGMVYGTK